MKVESEDKFIPLYDYTILNKLRKTIFCKKSKVSYLYITNMI